MRLTHLIFDLDGTLIDSSPSILGSIKTAFNAIGISPTRALTPALLGPPLAETLTSMLSAQDAHRLADLIEHFKRHYDEIGYCHTGIYDGVPTMLSALNRQGMRLFVATNKRILPTRKIIEHFQWARLFKGVYALDYFNPPLQNKSEMLRRLLSELGCKANQAIYVGDRLDDAIAAQENRIPFVHAAWGYDEAFLGNWHKAQRPYDLISILLNGGLCGNPCDT